MTTDNMFVIKDGTRIRVVTGIVTALLSGCDDNVTQRMVDLSEIGTSFDPIGTTDGGWLHIPDPYTYPLNDYHGIGGIAYDFGPEYADDIAVSVQWSGVFPLEGGPLLHVVQGTATLGIGAWPAHDLTGDAFLTPVMFLGVIGDPPSAFAVLDSAPYAHTNGTPRTIEIRSQGGMASVYLDGELLVGPTAIPAELVGSSMHGVALDTHFTVAGYVETLHPDVLPAPPPTANVAREFQIRKLE